MSLPAALESEDLQVEGWIASLPEIFYRNSRFLLRVDKLFHQENKVSFSGYIRLSWYSRPPPALRVGDKWRLTIRVRRARGLVNPAGFDYERWLYMSDIIATGYVRNTPEPELIADSVRFPVDRYRQHLSQRIRTGLEDNAFSGVLTALAVGDRQYISDHQWQVFSRTGTGHLMAISGLHIGLIAGTLFFLIRFFWTLSFRLTRLLPAPKAAALGSFAGALGYAMLAGLTLPTQRALIMLAVVLLALLWQRTLMAGHSLCLALLAVLLYDPYAPLANGFWLSFLAVAAIIYVSAGYTYTSTHWQQWIKLQVIIGIALSPVLLILFQSVTPISPLANLIAIPWVSITVVPLTLLAIVGGIISDIFQTALLQTAALTMAWLWEFLEWLSAFSWAQLHLPAPPLWTLWLALPGVLLLLTPPGIPCRWAGLLCCLPLLLFPRHAPAPGSAEFTLLDVGQGLAIVVRTAESVLVYDTGPRLGPGYDAARAALIPLLRQQGIDRIDMLIISHPDSQHTGGIRSLLEAFTVGRVLTSDPVAIPVTDAETCHAGSEWRWQRVTFRMLGPAGNEGLTNDDLSCILQIEAHGQRLLLTGDLAAAGQLSLLKHYSAVLASHVLVAPDQESTPALPTFIAAVQPKYVLFSTSYNNRHDYPRAPIMENYRRTGTKILNTAEHGAIRINLGADKTITPVSYRQVTKRYWHNP